MAKKRFSTLLALIVLIIATGSPLFSSKSASSQGLDGYVLDQAPAESPPDPGAEILSGESPYFTVLPATLADGTAVEGILINGPPEPPAGSEEERQASIMALPSRGVISSFPSYDWVFGCSAVSGAMIAGYYDRNGYSNMYTGPTNGGVMPVSDTAWSSWSDSYNIYPNNPLVASHNGVDGRTTRGSIDDYWVRYGSSANDPYITNSWTQHAWGSAMGDFMKTSQSAYKNVDGSTWFWTYENNQKFTCAAMESSIYTDWGYISDFDGTYGRKLFYEARGYTVGDCYNQKTDNVLSGGFSLADFQAEIDAGHPVLLNLYGHSIVGYGYSGSTIYIRDTWDSDPNNTYTMTWGGAYPPGPDAMDLYSVSVVRLNPLPTPPSAPNDVSATDGTFSNKIQVSWSASSGATTYEVYRNTSNTHTGETRLTDTHVSSPYNDYSAVPNMPYYYWVKACNAAGCSTYSLSDSGWRDTPSTDNAVYLPLVVGGTGTSIKTLLNGNFESGAEGSWTEFSTHGWDIILHENDTPLSAHGGTWLAWLGGDFDDTSYISQSVSIPSSMPYLHYWYWLASEDVCEYDFFRVKVGSTTIQTKELCNNNNSGGWVHGVVNLSGYAGATVTLKFEVTTDSSLNSNLFLDDIFFSGTASASEAFIPAANVDSLTVTKAEKIN